MQCASEGLEFLDERKDFWQQQKPVYARKNEMHSYQKSKNFLKKLNTMEHEQKPSLSDRRGALPSTSWIDHGKTSLKYILIIDYHHTNRISKLDGQLVIPATVVPSP